MNTIIKVLHVSSLNFDVLRKSQESGHLSSSVSCHAFFELANDPDLDVTLLEPKYYKKPAITKLRNIILNVLFQLKICALSSKFDIVYLAGDQHYIIVYLLKFFKIFNGRLVVLNHFTYDYRIVSGIFKKLFLMLERYLLLQVSERILHSSEEILNSMSRVCELSHNHSKNAKWGASKNFSHQARAKLKPGSKSYIFAPGSANRDYQPLIDACQLLGKRLVILTTPAIERTLDYDKDIVTVEIFDTHDTAIFEKLWLHYFECSCVAIPVNNLNHVANGASVLAEAIVAEKSILITKMPTKYIHVEKEGIGLEVYENTELSWSSAINRYFIGLHGTANMRDSIMRIGDVYNTMSLYKALKYTFEELMHETK